MKEIIKSPVSAIAEIVENASNGIAQKSQSEWSIGYKQDADASSLILFDEDSIRESFNGYSLDGFEAPLYAGVPSLFVSKAKQNLVLSWGFGPLRPLQSKDIFMHPGYQGEASTLRFTSSRQAQYQIRGSFRDLDPYGGDGAVGSIALIRDGVSEVLWRKAWANGQRKPKKFKLSVDLKKGDQIDFDITKAGGYDFDSSALRIDTFEIVPSAVSISINDQYIPEDRRLLVDQEERKKRLVTVSREGGDLAKALKVDLEITGTAKLGKNPQESGDDYQLVYRSQMIQSNNFSVRFDPGESRTTFEMVPLTDSEQETTETIKFKMTGIQGDNDYEMNTSESEVQAYLTDASRYGIISKTGFNHVTAGRTLPFQVSKINNLNKRTQLQYLVTPFLDPSKPEIKFSKPASRSDFKRASEIKITNQNYNDLTQWQKLTFEKGETAKEFNIKTVKPNNPTQSKSARLWIYNEALSNGDFDDWLSNPAFEHVDFLIHSRPTLVFGDPTYNLEGEQAITNLGRFGGRNSKTTVQVAPKQYDTLTGLPARKDFGFVAEESIDFISRPSTRTFQRDTDDPISPNLFYYASDLPKTSSTTRQSDPARVFAWTARQVRNGQVGKTIVASQYGTIFENENSRPADQAQARINTRLLSQSNDQIRPSSRLSSLDMLAPQTTSLFGGITDAWNSFVASLNSAISSVASTFYGQEVTQKEHKKFAANINPTKVLPVPKVATIDSLQVTGSGSFLVPTRDGAGMVAVNGDSLDRFVDSSLNDSRVVRLIDRDAKALRRQINQLKSLGSDELQQVLDRYPVDGLNGTLLKDEINRLSKIKNDKQLLTSISRSSLIGLDGATLIGLDGATLIGLDGATFTLDSTLRLIGLDGATLRGKINVIKDISSAGLNVLSQLIGLDGATLRNEARRLSSLKDAQLLQQIRASKLIGLDGATLIGLDGATLVGLDGATFAALTANTLVGLDSATLAFQEPSYLAQMAMITSISPDTLSGF